VAAAIFSIEVISVGILHYSAIVPCMISSVTGYFVAGALGVTYFELDAKAPAVEAAVVLKTVLFAALCGILSWLACFCFEKTADIMQKLFRNEFYRAAAGGGAVVLLTLLVRTDMYNGIGADVIYSAFESRMLWYAFLLKLIFTALTLGSGFKGGEIVPIFFIGSCFGSSLSGLFDVPPSFFAAMGMIALFCGVTNCPVSSILIGIELFGSENIVYCGIACAVSYMLSGYRGLYHEQRIAYSKLKTKYINKQVE
jgi:H+/Cl- antiporter ClcA